MHTQTTTRGKTMKGQAGHTHTRRIVREGYILTKQEVNWFRNIDRAGKYILKLLNITVDRDDETGCWYWPKAHNVEGYGRVWWDGNAQGTHRWLYQQATRSRLRHNYVVTHTYVVTGCTRDCIRPSHLEAVTLNEVGRRRRDANCPAGHPYTRATTSYVYDPARGVSERVCTRCHPPELPRVRTLASSFTK